VIRKFFLHVSKKEQKKRFLERLEDSKKNWKFSMADVQERGFWKDYQEAYEEMIQHTRNEACTLVRYPADNKWFTRLAVASAIIETLNGLNLAFPTSRKPRRRNCRLFAPRFFPRRISSSSPAGAPDKVWSGYLSSPRSGVPAPPQNGSFTAKELPHPSRTCKNSTPCFILHLSVHRRIRATPILLNNLNLWRLHMEIGWERQSNAGKLLRHNHVRE